MPALGPFADVGKALVKAVSAKQLFVRADLGDPAVVYHKDLISVLHRRKAMRNGNDRFASRQLGERLLDQVLVFRVDAGGRLVKNDDGSVFQNGAGNGNALLLAAGQRAAALADDGVVAVGQCHDKVMTAAFFAASIISASVASGLPKRILARTVS